MTFSNKDLTLAETLKHTKIKTVEDLFKNIDSILELVRSDVERLARKNKLYFADFDFFFSESKKQLQITLNKRTKAVLRVFSCSKIELAAKWLVGRILSNMRNFSTNKNYKNYCYIAGISEIDYHIASEDDDFEMIDIDNDLQKMSKEELENGLKKIYYELDFFEFENLCKKYNLDSVEVMGFNPSEMPEIEVFKNANGNEQLAFAF